MNYIANAIFVKINVFSFVYYIKYCLVHIIPDLTHQYLACC